MPNNNAINNISLNQKVTQIAANYTALANDVIIEVTNTAAPRTITLPTPTANNAGKFYVVKDTSGGAATNNISIFPASGLIDGSANLVIATGYGAIQVYSDGSSYYSQAFVIPNPTGIPLASGYWYRFTSGAGAGITQGTTGANTPGPNTSRVNFSNLTADHVVNIDNTTSTLFLTIIRPGLYFLACNTSVASSVINAGPIVQIVKNNTTVLAAADTGLTTVSDVANNNTSCAVNLVAGDIIDVRFNNYNGISGWSFLMTTILVQQLPTTF